MRSGRGVSTSSSASSSPPSPSPSFYKKTNKQTDNTTIKLFSCSLYTFVCLQVEVGVSLLNHEWLFELSTKLYAKAIQSWERWSNRLFYNVNGQTSYPQLTNTMKMFDHLAGALGLFFLHFLHIVKYCCN